MRDSVTFLTLSNKGLCMQLAKVASHALKRQPARPAALQVYLASQCSTGPLHPELYRRCWRMVKNSHATMPRTCLCLFKHPLLTTQAQTLQCVLRLSTGSKSELCTSAHTKISHAHHVRLPLTFVLGRSGSVALALGVESGPAMTPECAAVKMMLCLAHPNIPLGVPIAGEM